MERQQFDFNIQEAGSLLYLADRNLGGSSFAELDGLLNTNGRLRELTLAGAIMAMALYQDDGYSIRVVQGDLTEEEKSQWLSRVNWRLNLESGRLVVSGICNEDLEDYLEEFETVDETDEHEFGCLIDLPEGYYQADVYSYPPNDLAGGLLTLETRSSFREYFGGNEDFEKIRDYFSRTHPGMAPPDWIKEGYQDADFLDFVIHLTPLPTAVTLTAGPQFDEDGNCLKWSYRKPGICPVGILIGE